MKGNIYINIGFNDLSEEQHQEVYLYILEDLTENGLEEDLQDYWVYDGYGEIDPESTIERATQELCELQNWELEIDLTKRRYNK